MDNYTKETKLLDFSNKEIVELIRNRGWKELPKYERIKAIYNYVRDEILFGYNTKDALKASRILKDGYGQCNTKGTLLMALFRACGIPCRMHAFYVDKGLQKGIMSNLVFNLAPNDVFHSYVEVFLEGTWNDLEGVIIDKMFLDKLQKINSNCNEGFYGYGVAVKDFKNLPIEFNRTNTYIQSESITKDLGIYDTPDDLFKVHSQKTKFIKTLLYKYIGRHMMNKNVKRIRNKAI